jgi:hypothetical protein
MRFSEYELDVMDLEQYEWLVYWYENGPLRWIWRKQSPSERTVDCSTGKLGSLLVLWAISTAGRGRLRSLSKNYSLRATTSMTRQWSETSLRAKVKELLGV